MWNLGPTTNSNPTPGFLTAMTFHRYVSYRKPMLLQRQSCVSWLRYGKGKKIRTVELSIFLFKNFSAENIYIDIHFRIVVKTSKENWLSTGNYHIKFLNITKLFKCQLIKYLNPQLDVRIHEKIKIPTEVSC